MTEDKNFAAKDKMEDKIIRDDELPMEDGAVFPGQRKDEKLEFILRKHEITLLYSFIIFVFLAAFPFILYLTLIPRAFPAFLQKPYQDIYFLAITVYYGFLLIITFMEWLDYYLDVWIITDQRILAIEQKGFFHRVTSEVDLRRVQDITTTVNGPVQTFFGFGNIEIQTASEENKIQPKSIPHPVTVRRKIMDLCKEAQEKDRFIFKEEMAE